MENNKRFEGLKCCLVSALMCLCFIFLIFGISRVLPGRKSNFIAGDALAQAVPIIKMMFKHFFEGESLTYSFECGMGMPTTALYAYYGLSPFNLLFLVTEDINTAYFIVYAAKLMVTSAAMALLIYKVRAKRLIPCATFGCAYAMNAFALSFNYGMTFFFDMMYLLPLIVLALWYFVKNGKWFCLCILYAVSFVIQFYSAYMIGIFSFLIYLCFAYYSYGNEWKQWKKSLFSYILCVTTAVLIAAPVLLPTGIELFTHTASDRTTLDFVRLMPWDFIESFYPGYSEEVFNTKPAIYCGLLPLIMCILWFGLKNISRRERLILALPLIYLVLCFFISPLYLFMHAFDAPDGYNYRFSWLVSFWMIFLAAGLPGEKENWENLSKKSIILTSLLLLIINGILLFTRILRGNMASEQPISFDLISCVFIISYAFLLFFGKNTVFYRSVCFGIAILEVLCGGVMNRTIVDENIMGKIGYYKLWQEQADTALSMIMDQEKDDPSSFYRICYQNGPMDNLSMLKNYHGLGWFSSIENEKLRGTLKQLGYATSFRTVHDYGSSELMRMLFAQKYSVECASIYGEHAGEFSVWKNRLNLSPAYMTSETILEWQPDDSDPFTSQNMLAEAMCGVGDIWNEREAYYGVMTNGMEWIPFDGGVLIQKASPDGAESNAIITLPDKGEDVLYLYIPRKKSHNDDKSPLLISASDIGGVNNKPLLSMPRIMPLALNEKNEWECSVLMNDTYEMDFSTLYFASMDQEALDRVYNKLKPGELKLSNVSENEWTGRINVKSEMPVLFTTIPFDDGWELYVDGTKTEIIPLLGDAFLGARLDEGEHDIHLVFHNPWIIRGVFAGVAGVIILFSYLLCIKRSFFGSVPEMRGRVGE